MDPFSGSATTLTVSKKLGRRWLGFDISPDYIARGRARLAAAREGDRLDGAAEPLVSVPKTTEGRTLESKVRKKVRGQQPRTKNRGKQKSLPLSESE
jgi:site-specific DNA-methyltransferase (adenine-specific)